MFSFISKSLFSSVSAFTYLILIRYHCYLPSANSSEKNGKNYYSSVCQPLTFTTPASSKFSLPTQTPYCGCNPLGQTVIACRPREIHQSYAVMHTAIMSLISCKPCCSQFMYEPSLYTVITMISLACLIYNTHK